MKMSSYQCSEESLENIDKNLERIANFLEMLCKENKIN